MTFSSVALLILNMFKDSAEFNVATILPQLFIAPACGATFSIARYKIKLSFFLGLNDIISAHIKSCLPKTWKGYRLIAGDGTTVSLPPSPQVKKHFGIFDSTKSNKHTCLANACMLYDVLSGLVLDTIIAPSSIGESTLITPMINKAHFPGSIILLDRGFGYFSTCKNLINNELNYCIRIKASQSTFAKKILAEPLTDFITDWVPGESERKTCKQGGLDVLPIRVRVTKIILDSGEMELLVSNPSIMDTIDEAAMKELYAMRWGVEEGFKKLKPKMKLEQFGCRRHEGVYQEFYAHIFVMNLVTIIGNEAEEAIKTKTKTRKLVYKYNWQNAFRFVRNKFISIFSRREFLSSLECIINQIVNSLIAIKANRKFPRHEGGKRKPRFTQGYK